MCTACRLCKTERPAHHGTAVGMVCTPTVSDIHEVEGVHINGVHTLMPTLSRTVRAFPLPAPAPYSLK